MPAVPRRIVALDIETTGLDATDGRLIEIAAVLLGPSLTVQQRFATLVDPDVPVRLAVTRLVGLRDEDLWAAPGEHEALSELSDFVGDALLVGHNAAFDRAHLAAGARRVGLPTLANDWFDTLEAALLLFPELDGHALSSLAERFECGGRAHRALRDAETTATVFSRLCARAAALGAEERRLLTGVGWVPLGVLDALEILPDAPVPALAGGNETGSSPAAAPSALPVTPDGWAAEMGTDGDGEPGLAARLPGFKRREGQEQLAGAAAEVLSLGGVGLFEAGTGSGKSLAYLLPAAFHSAATGRRVVVSTKTKALQRQLGAHELPLVAETLPEGWRWAILMGRENYLCRRQLDAALTSAGETLADTDRSLALAYLVGRTRRGDVDLSALPYGATKRLPALSGLARELRSSRATCLGHHCPRRASCLWRVARSRAEAAHLVCVNHALLLAGRETLPSFEDVVIDEAHLLYHEASEAFSDGVDAVSLAQLLSDLRRGGQRPLEGRLRSAALKADSVTAGTLAAAADASARAADALPGLVLAVGESLAAVARAADQAERGPDAAATGGRQTSDYDLSVWLTPGLREQPTWDDFATAAALLGEGLAALAGACAAAAEALPEDHREHAAVASMADQSGAYAELLDELPAFSAPESVVWGEVEAPHTAVRNGLRGRERATRWSLRRTPMTPARHVRQALWDRLRGAVLTSATLTVGGSFHYFRGMTGLDADLDVTERVFPSPFDFRRQAVLVLEHDPHEVWATQEAAQRQGERLKRLAEVTRGRTLALFTNKRDMHRVATVVGAHVEENGVLVLAQGLHGSAAALADEFRSDPETILFGVDTLWTGQDFPGKSLVCLVIAKLPFPRQDPLFRARCRACEESGERWFERFYLPEAVLKFRQGFGRLIRTETDFGVVVVLDHRLAQKSYRQDFLGSLPDVQVVESAPHELPATVEEHLRRLSAEARDLSQEC